MACPRVRDITSLYCSAAQLKHTAATEHFRWQFSEPGTSATQYTQDDIALESLTQYGGLFL